MSAHDPAGLPGGVFRVHWVPGTDRLLGVCYCGAEQEFEDPVVLWDWLLAHPDPSRPAEEPRRPAEEPRRPAEEPRRGAGTLGVPPGV